MGEGGKFTISPAVETSLTLRDKHSKYFTIVTGCGGIINADEGNISSPNYPNKYDQNLDCEWRIITSPGSRVLVYIDDLDIVDTSRYISSRSQVF